MYWSRAPLLVVSCLLLGYAAAIPKALSVTPSDKFYGDDGSWSAISIRVGSPQQWVDVLVSTGISETWVVNSTACGNSPLCVKSRGRVFNFTNSTTWKPLGPFELGLDLQLGFSGAGDYGLDVLEFGSTGLIAQDSIIASINTQEYWVGFFGVGIVPGNFTQTTALSPISNLVEKAGLIPSHSYGFTAGSSYQSKTEPCSLTLGGYDANRFVPHDVSFDLNPSQQPEAFIDSISVSIPPGSSGNLSSNPLVLMSHAEGVSVLVDSSTPFLWLPKSICERFAAALGLTYNSTLSLYTFDSNISRHDDLLTWGLNFTFSLANNATSPEIVNITLPYNAFDLQLTFPYINGSHYGSDDANKYYFPLRQAANDTQYTIGRSFLQEAYMIVDYERNNFSIHQAIHIANPMGNTNIVDITRPITSTFTSTPSIKASGLPKGAIIGLAAGGVAILILAALLLWLVLRRRRRNSATEDEKDEQVTHPRTPGSKSQFTVDGSELRSPISVSTEVDSVANERHEMFAPMPDPMELDASVAAVPRTPRDGTEKVKFSTYQQALWREQVERPSGMGMSALVEERVPVSGPPSGAVTPIPGQEPAVPPVQSAAAFLARMIERKNGGGEIDDPPRTRGRRGETKDKQRETDDELERHVRYASERDSWTPGDDYRTRDEMQTESTIAEGDSTDIQPTTQPATTGESRVTRSDSILKTPLSPKVLVIGRRSFMMGRQRGMPS